MPRFERSRKRETKGPSRGARGGKSSGRSRDFEEKPRDRRTDGRRGSRDFEEKPRGRSRGFDDRSRGRRDSGRRELEMTKVTCSDCGEKCEVPFKPTSSKPVFCSDCFTKKERSGSRGPSNQDLEKINEKLDKIMKALKITSK